MRTLRVVARAILPLAVRHLAAHRVAAGVAFLAMASGVASITATTLMYESVVASYEATVVRLAGRAALQVTNGKSGVPEELADELRRDARVLGVAASVEEFVPTADFPGEQLYLYGIDLLADQEMRDYGSTSHAVVSDPLVFLAEPDSVALTAAFLSAHGLKLHDHVRVLAPSGVVELTIRAVLGAQRGPASAFDGRVAVVDLSVAQDMLKSPGRVSQLAIETAPNVDLAALERTIVQIVGERGVVERPKSRVASFARLVTNYRYGLLLAAATSTVVALYFVFNIATIAVVDRRQELGLLRTIGMGSSGMIALVLGELLGIALLASAVGVPLGLGLARVLARTLGASVAALYLDVGVPAPMLRLGSGLWSVGLGLLTAFVAALAPIHQVLAIAPLDVRSSPGDQGPSASYVIAALTGGGLLGCSFGVWVWRAMLPVSAEAAGIVAMLGAVLAMALIVPFVVRLVTAFAERLAQRSSSATLLLASRSLASEIGRVVLTCSAGLVSLGGTIAVASWAASFDATLDAAFDTVFARIDLLVSAGADPFAIEATRMPASVADEIASLPEVDFVDPVRITTVGFDGSLVSVVAGDAQLYVQGRRRLHMVDGDSIAVGRDLASGSSVVVNQTFVSRFHLRCGDMLDLATPDGALRVRIAGVYLDLSPGDLATVHLDRALYRRHWRDDTANLLGVSLHDGADRRRVIETIRTRWAERRVVVFTLEQMRREYAAMLTHLSSLVYPLLGAAVIVALVGIISARVASMMMRVRVSGVLRAVGATRAQLARVFVIEAAMIGGVAATLAAVAGSALGRMEIAILMRGMLGMSVLYAYPRAVACVGGLGIVLLTSIAGWVLGRQAAGMGVGEALRWE